jgi:hypothetical protein
MGLWLLFAGSCVGPDLEPPGGSRPVNASSNDVPPTTKGSGGAVASTATTAATIPAQLPMGAQVAGRPSNPGGVGTAGTSAPVVTPPTTAPPPPAAGAAASNPAEGKQDSEDAGVADAGADAGFTRRR